MTNEKKSPREAEEKIRRPEQSDERLAHLEWIGGIAQEDCDAIREKERTYHASWKRRGGMGAFMMLARKWDRLENILSSRNLGYDIFEGCRRNLAGDDGTVLAEVRDLRRYLLLVESEVRREQAERREEDPADFPSGEGEINGHWLPGSVAMDQEEARQRRQDEARNRDSEEAIRFDELLAAATTAVKQQIERIDSVLQGLQPIDPRDKDAALLLRALVFVQQSPELSGDPASDLERRWLLDELTERIVPPEARFR